MVSRKMPSEIFPSFLADANGACWQWVRAYYIYGDDLRGSSIFSKIAKADAEGKKLFRLLQERINMTLLPLID